jgi:hypothetical protein
MLEDKGVTDIALEQNDLRLELEHGYAECMGDGLFIVFKVIDGEPYSVPVSRSDLARMLAASE